MSGRLILDLEIVTPIFLGGTNSSELANEIRISSIRGEIRYWLRALLGVRFGSDTKSLKEHEGFILGSTQAGSCARFRVLEPKQGLLTAERMMLPHRQVNGNGNPLRREAFVENQGFRLIISPRPGLGRLPDEFVAALLLWLSLGGLGKRSRRGFGSLRLLRAQMEGDVVSTEAQTLLSTIPNGTVDLQRYVYEVVTWSLATIGNHAAVTGATAPYPILQSEFANVLVCQAAESPDSEESCYQQVMVPFWLETLRSSHLRDERAYGHARQGRRASPFHLHIAKTAEGYHLILTTFWAEPSSGGAGGWHLVERLIADSRQRWHGQIVWGRDIS